jgi:hypothetical protein
MNAGLGLGRELSCHRVHNSIWIGRLVGAAILLMSLAAWWLDRTLPGGDRILHVVSTAGIVVGGAMLGYGLWRRRFAAALHEHGSLFLTGDKGQPVSWREPAALRQDRRKKSAGALFGRRDRFTLVTRKGRVFTFTNHLKGAESLAIHIAKQLHAPLVVEALTAISKGHRASFGPVILSMAGIEAAGKCLEWPNVEKIERSNGVLRVIQRGKFLARKNGAIASIDNLSVLLACSDELGNRMVNAPTIDIVLR